MARYYPTEDLPLNIARGLVKGTKFVHVNGSSGALAGTEFATVWDYPDELYPWDAAFATANSIYLTANVLDNNNEVVIVGLDSNYDELTETVTIQSGTANTTNNFIRVQYAYLNGNSSLNIQDIHFKCNGENVARITANTGKSMSGIYTVPRNHTAYLVKGTMSAQKASDAQGEMFVRYSGTGPFIAGHAFEVGGDGGQYNYKFACPIPLPEKSDIDVRVKTRTNNHRYTVGFDIILIKTGLDGDYEQYVGQ